MSTPLGKVIALCAKMEPVLKLSVAPVKVTVPSPPTVTPELNSLVPLLKSRVAPIPAVQVPVSVPLPVMSSVPLLTVTEPVLWNGMEDIVVMKFEDWVNVPSLLNVGEMPADHRIFELSARVCTLKLAPTLLVNTVPLLNNRSAPPFNCMLTMLKLSQVAPKPEKFKLLVPVRFVVELAPVVNVPVLLKLPPPDQLKRLVTVMLSDPVSVPPVFVRVSVAVAVPELRFKVPPLKVMAVLLVL